MGLAGPVRPFGKHQVSLEESVHSQDQDVSMGLTYKSGGLILVLPTA
jgi:hypothetical protein